MGVELDCLVTSPLLRAVQTAEIVARVFRRSEPPLADDALGHHCTVQNVTKLVARFPPDARVALVGHEPDLSRIAAQFIGRSGDAAIDLKKGGIIGIAWDGPAAPGTGTLIYLLRPGQLRKLARSRT
jgi:phosphohistidine phosphatase